MSALGEPLELRIVQPKLRWWSESSIATHHGSDDRMDLTCGGTCFGCDWGGSIYMGIAKFRGLCTTIKLPDGYSAEPANATIALEPGESTVYSFRLSGPTRPPAPLPVEAVLTLPGVGELRESGTVPAPLAPTP